MVSGIVTAILLASFIAGTAWAFSARRRAEFDRAARLPLEETLPQEGAKESFAGHQRADVAGDVRTGDRS
jgi:cytochrome c oxidase cbb3-type subunit 4